MCVCIRMTWLPRASIYLCHDSHVRLYTAPEASWRWVFDPCTPLLFDLYHYLDQNRCFWLVPEHAPGPSSQVLPGCRVRHPFFTKELFVRHMTWLKTHMYSYDLHVVSIYIWHDSHVYLYTYDITEHARLYTWHDLHVCLHTYDMTCMCVCKCAYSWGRVGAWVYKGVCVCLCACERVCVYVWRVFFQPSATAPCGSTALCAQTYDMSHVTCMLQKALYQIWSQKTLSRIQSGEDA